MIVKKSRMTLAMFLMVILSGCIQVNQPKPNDPRFAPVIPNSSVRSSVATGSIYQENFSQDLWFDMRAKRVGDIITILLDESTAASKSAKTSSEKEAQMTASIPTILGTNPSLKAGGFLLPSKSKLTLETLVNSQNDFSGESGTDQSNSLSGSIAVTISKILSNGLFVVQGEKWITLTEGEEFIRISGLIRASDVQPDNTIVSSKLADARITYSGTGDLANSNKMGWLQRIFNSPYWPL